MKTQSLYYYNLIKDEKIDAVFGSRFIEGSNIIDIGCGIGGSSRILAQDYGFNVLGVDIFPDYVKKINNKIFRSYEPFVNDYLIIRLTMF